MQLSFSQCVVTAIAVSLASLHTVRAFSRDEQIRMGDVLDAKFESAKALEYYLPSLQSDPGNVKLLLNVARQYRHMMSDVQGKSEKLKLGAIALSYSFRAATLAPDNSDAQLSVAISYGKMLPFQTIKDQIQATPLIKVATEKALRINPHNDTAWYIMGRWQRVLAGINPVKRALLPLFYEPLPSGSNEAAVVCLQKAIAINPHRLMDYIEMGLVYAQLRQPELARGFILKGLAMPDVEKDDPETKGRGREILATLN